MKSSLFAILPSTAMGGTVEIRLEDGLNEKDVAKLIHDLSASVLAIKILLNVDEPNTDGISERDIKLKGQIRNHAQNLEAAVHQVCALLAAVTKK